MKRNDSDHAIWLVAASIVVILVELYWTVEPALDSIRHAIKAVLKYG